MTMVFMKYKGNGKFLHAGSHTDLIVYHQEDKKCVQYKTKGIYLGLLKDISDSLEDQVIQLQTGDILCIYTDGIIEAKDKDNQLNGVEWLMDIIELNADQSVEDIKELIFSEVLHYCDNNRKDDMTMILARYIGF